ncbi:MAG: phosphate ABC transporter, permease protein PstA [Chloroflexi bacterium RBG_16_63_12]|nr:MAG: phosphate ABC transporter, permease protein PstA [Chloroflexi bacterium RBG_16_63_12]
MSAVTASGQLPEDRAFKQYLQGRRRVGWVWQSLFLLATCIGILALMALLYNIVDGAFGYVAYEDKVDAATISDRPLEGLSQEELVAVLQANLSRGAFNKLNDEQPFAQRSQGDVYNLVLERVLQRKVVAAWSLTDSLTKRATIEAELAKEHPNATLVFRSWLSLKFLQEPMSSQPLNAGVRTAILGSLWLIAITIAVALPIGVGAAIYLQEYADHTRWYNRLIETNIYNLAGVPSIVYGILGLAIFVRALEFFSSGAMFGVTDSNGRTIISAALTMALLTLPLIIVNAQEAIKAVPDSFRQASYGLGATKWQTIWAHVLPNALPGVLTGSILAVSRAIGETAPLIVIGASTFITVDPSSVFSKFTALPIQIYTWTSRPLVGFRNIAAASILVLLVLLLALNATAILLRNRFSRRLY